MTPTERPNETGQQPTPDSTSPTPQQASRAEVYARYYAPTTSGDAPAPQQPQTPDPTAQVATPTDTPVAPPQSSPDLIQTIQAMREQMSQMAEVIQRLQSPAPAAKPAVEPAPAPAPTGPDTTFVDLLREGKFNEAQEFLLAKAEERAASKVTPQAIDASVARAREIARAEAEMERFVEKIRAENSDLGSFEDYVVLRAEQSMNRLRSEGKLQSTEDVVKAYKEQVLDAVTHIRKLAQQLRGAGKEEARVVREEVLSTSTVAPSAVDTARGQQTTQDQEPKAETAQDYLAKRIALANRQKQLVVA